MARDAFDILRTALAQLARDLYRDTMKKPARLTIEVHPLVYREVVCTMPPSAPAKQNYDLKRPALDIGIDGFLDYVTVMASEGND